MATPDPKATTKETLQKRYSTNYNKTYLLDFVPISFNKEELQKKFAQNIADSRKKQNPSKCFLNKRQCKKMTSNGRYDFIYF